MAKPYIAFDGLSGTCEIRMMPVGATVMAVKNKDGEFEDFYFKPDRIEPPSYASDSVTLLRGGAGGYSKRGFGAEVNIPATTAVRWEIQ